MSLILSGSDGLSDIDGSAATPAIRGTDANTGIFFPAADTIAFAEGGVEAARFDSTGAMVLGKTSNTNANNKLYVVGPLASYTSAATTLATSATSASVRLGFAQDSSQSIYSGMATDGTNYPSYFQATNGDGSTASNLTLQPFGGSLLVGTTKSPATSGLFNSSALFKQLNDSSFQSGIQIEANANTNVFGIGYNGDTFAIGATYRSTGSFVGISFWTSGSERARIDSSGNLLVGTTSSSATSGNGLKVTSGSGNADSVSVVTTATTNGGLTTYQLYSTGAAAYRFYVGAGGTIFATSTVISAISDIRFKENVRDLDVGLNKIMALKPRLYDWKEGKGSDIKNARGFIAQEFETVFPDMIDEWKDPAPEGEEPYKSVRADLIPVLVKAIQEQQALITQLQADVAALKAV